MNTSSRPVDAAVAAYREGQFADAHARFSVLARAGDPEAQAWIGSLHANGEGVPTDLEAAFAWYLRAAEQDHVPAQTNVGAMLVMGQGTAADPVAGLHWLTRAAQAGDAMAQSNLATLYFKGDRVPHDEAAAAHWYRRAAEQGHYPSQARLGFMYANGLGVEKDRAQAFAWLSLAAQHGVGTALNALEGIVGQMSVEEKHRGAAQFDQWRTRTAAVSSPARLVPVPG